MDDTNLDTLPPELQVEIVRKLDDPASHRSLGQVSKRQREVVNDPREAEHAKTRFARPVKSTTVKESPTDTYREQKDVETSVLPSGARHGKYKADVQIDHHDRYDDTITTRGEYVDGRKHGTWTKVYTERHSHAGEKVTPWVHGEKHGKEVVYDEDGNVMKEVAYDRGKFVAGRAVEPDGRLVWERYMGPGQQFHRVYHPDGKLARDTPYKDGYMHGVEKTYREDGSLESMTAYQHADRHGHQYIIGPDGNPEQVIRWQRGQKAAIMRYEGDKMVEQRDFPVIHEPAPHEDGIHRTYWPHGTVHRMWSVVGGKPHGHVIVHDEVGTKKERLNFHHGEQHGEQRSYYLDGSVSMIEHYDHGLLRSRVSYDKEGKVKKVHRVDAHPDPDK